MYVWNDCRDEHDELSAKNLISNKLCIDKFSRGRTKVCHIKYLRISYVRRLLAGDWDGSQLDIGMFQWALAILRHRYICILEL